MFSGGHHPIGGKVGAQGAGGEARRDWASPECVTVVSTLVGVVASGLGLHFCAGFTLSSLWVLCLEAESGPEGLVPHD